MVENKVHSVLLISVSGKGYRVSRLCEQEGRYTKRDDGFNGDFNSVFKTLEVLYSDGERGKVVITDEARKSLGKNAKKIENLFSDQLL